LKNKLLSYFLIQSRLDEITLVLPRVSIRLMVDFSVTLESSSRTFDLGLKALTSPVFLLHTFS